MNRPRDVRFILVGVPSSRRTDLFQTALERLGLEPARVISWLDVLNGTVNLEANVADGDVVRIDSPGRDFELEKRLLVEGSNEPDEIRFARTAAREAANLPFDQGRILWPRQWYLGFRKALETIRRQLMQCPPHFLMNDIDDIAVMFDKRQCHARLKRAGVPVPRELASIASYGQLLAEMKSAGLGRVFIKLAHGSSGSGVVAFQTDGNRQQAISTTEMVARNGELCLYNSRQLRAYREPRQIAMLINELCRHNVHVEQWIPKAGINGKVMDLRVVVIRGRARHVVVRMSRWPITNLHLLNERATPDALRQAMGEPAWDAGMLACEAAMGCFHASLHGGVDLLVGCGFRTHAVAEVNAFGDLLPGTVWHGMDTYETEIRSVLGKDAAVELEVSR